MRRLAGSLALLASLALASTLRAAEQAPPDQWVYKGDGLVVKLHEKAGAHGGTVTLDGKTYPFTGTIKDGVLTGTFTVGEGKFPFTLKTTDADAKKAVFESDGTKYNVTETDDAAPPAAGEDPKPVAPEPEMPKEPTPVDPPAPAPPQPGPVAEDGPPRAIVLERRGARDKTTDLDISTLLVPRGWHFANETMWRHKLMQWVAAYVEAVDPRTGTAVRWLPADQFAADPTIYQTFLRQGSPLVTQAGYELSMKALDAQEYVTDVVIPRYRKVPGLKIVGAGDAPWFQREIEQTMARKIAMDKQAGMETAVQCKRVRVEYPAGPNSDVTIEEDIYCCVSHSSNPQMVAMARQTGMSGTVYFQSQRLYSLAAPKGKLDAMTPLLQAIADSTRVTPEWEQFVRNIELMRRQADFNDASLVNAARVQVSEQQRQDWLQRQEVQDRIAQGRGDGLSGVHRFVEPTDPGARVIVPQTYGRAFSDGQGHYVLTNDPLYNARQDPNLNGNWEEMQPQH